MRHRLAVLLMLAATAALAQPPKTRIRVEVTSESVPVQDADVTANGKQTRTGPDGVAVLAIEVGHVDVAVSKDRFFTARKALDIDAAREWQIQVELQPQMKQEEEIRVYATRTDVRVQDSPLHVEVVSQDEINEEVAMRPGDISMLLNEMGGMRVQTTSPALGAASVRVQGMRGRYTAFLSDGLPLFGQQGAGLGLLQIPPMDLGQVEVIKGNASALYGSAAMAGVVNLISRRPEAEPLHEFLFNRSSLGETDASMFLTSQMTPHWGASLLGGGYWQEQQDVNGDGWADVAGYSRGVVRPRFYWDNKKRGTALLTGGVIYEDRSGGTVSGAMLQATGEPYTEALNTKRYDAGGICNGCWEASSFWRAAFPLPSRITGISLEKTPNGTGTNWYSANCRSGERWVEIHGWRALPIKGMLSSLVTFRASLIHTSFLDCLRRTISTWRHGSVCRRAPAWTFTMSTARFLALACPHFFGKADGPAAFPWDKACSRRRR
jgi:outer membrane receptor for ferrienterochelin and colicins